MNHAELCALVAEREKRNIVWVSIKTEELKELLAGYREPEPPAVPWIGAIASDYP